VNRYQWLLFLHVTGAFMVLGGAVMAAIFNFAALRRERPSEVVVLFRLAQIAVRSITTGMVVALAFGLWLVSEADYGWGETWIVLALILWVLTNAMGGAGGRRDKRTREFAERLAAEGDQPSTELHGRLRDPISLVLSWGSGVVVIAILALMIWKPGA
jgi:uncharacterized membrane protein